MNDGMLTPEDFKAMDGIEFSETCAKSWDEESKKFQAFIDHCALSAYLGVGLPADLIFHHPIELFDSMTRMGFKLNLVTGEYYVSR